MLTLLKLLSLPLLIFITVVLPLVSFFQLVWAVIDCAGSERSKSKKSIWILFIVFLWFLGSAVYGLFYTNSKKLFYLTLFSSGPLFLFIAISWIMYIQDPAPVVNLSNIATQMDRIGELTRLLIDDPNDLRYLVERATEYDKLNMNIGRDDDLNDFFSRVKKLAESDSAELIELKAKAFLLRGSFDQASEEVEKGIKLYPNDQGLKRLRAVVEERKGQ